MAEIKSYSDSDCKEEIIKKSLIGNDSGNDCDSVLEMSTVKESPNECHSGQKENLEGQQVENQPIMNGSNCLDNSVLLNTAHTNDASTNIGKEQLSPSLENMTNEELFEITKRSRTETELMEYREPSDNDTTTDSSDDESGPESGVDPGSSGEDLSDDERTIQGDKGQTVKKSVHRTIRTKGELSLEDLPPIADLNITVDESVNLYEIGQISSLLGLLVVVQAKPGVPALNLDSVLFREGRKAMGQVFETLGPVASPLYTVRFNSVDDIEEEGISVGDKVFYAPEKDEYTRFVFMEELRRVKGSDASWEHNNEPPAKYLDYSDDEEERRAKRGDKTTDGEKSTQKPGKRRREKEKKPDSGQQKQHQHGAKSNKGNRRQGFQSWPPKRGEYSGTDMNPVFKPPPQPQILPESCIQPPSGDFHTRYPRPIQQPRNPNSGQPAHYVPQPGINAAFQPMQSGQNGLFRHLPTESGPFRPQPPGDCGSFRPPPTGDCGSFRPPPPRNSGSFRLPPPGNSGPFGPPPEHQHGNYRPPSHNVHPHVPNPPQSGVRQQRPPVFGAQPQFGTRPQFPGPGIRNSAEPPPRFGGPPSLDTRPPMGHAVGAPVESRVVSPPPIPYSCAGPSPPPLGPSMPHPHGSIQPFQNRPPPVNRVTGPSVPPPPGHYPNTGPPIENRAQRPFVGQCIPPPPVQYPSNSPSQPPVGPGQCPPQYSGPPVSFPGPGLHNQQFVRPADNSTFNRPQAPQNQVQGDMNRLTSPGNTNFPPQSVSILTLPPPPPPATEFPHQPGANTFSQQPPPTVNNHNLPPNVPQSHAHSYGFQSGNQIVDHRLMQNQNNR